LFGKFEAGAYELQIDKFLRDALTGSVIILNVVHKPGFYRAICRNGLMGNPIDPVGGEGTTLPVLGQGLE
jgi:hypothetical protein